MFFSRTAPSNTMTYSEHHLRNTILLNLKESRLTRIGLVVGLGKQAVSHIINRYPKGCLFVKALGDQAPSRSRIAGETAWLIENGRAESYSFTDDNWTCNWVGLSLSKRTAWHTKSSKWAGFWKNWLDPSKSPKKEAQQDGAKVEQWKTVELPALKTKRWPRDTPFIITTNRRCNAMLTWCLPMCRKVRRPYCPFRYQRVLARVHRQQLFCQGKYVFPNTGLFLQGQGHRELPQKIDGTYHRKDFIDLGNASWHKSDETSAFLRSKEGNSCGWHSPRSMPPNSMFGPTWNGYSCLIGPQKTAKW